MDAAMRGIISEKINRAFEEQKILETVDWLLEADDQIYHSREDLALGYFIGSLMSMAADIVRTIKLGIKRDKMYRRNLKKIYGKEGAKEVYEKHTLERIRAKGGRPLKIELTENEKDDIKNMLIPMIARFREKIRQEEALRKTR